MNGFYIINRESLFTENIEWSWPEFRAFLHPQLQALSDDELRVLMDRTREPLPPLPVS